MYRYYNTATGEIIMCHSLKEAKAYFKADGKINHYRGRTKPFKTQSSITISKQNKCFDRDTLGIAIGGLSIAVAIIIFLVCIALQ